MLILLSALITLPGIQNGALWDRDETFYAECAREMLERGDFLVPHFNGKPFLEKPPLAYWFMALGFKLFGVGELGARFFSAIFGIGAVLFVFFTGKRLSRKEGGLLPALVLASSLLFVVASRLALTDAYLLFSLAGALYFFTLVVTEPRKPCDRAPHNSSLVLPRAPGGSFARARWVGWLGFGAMCGGAFLAKGPVGILLPVASALAFLFWRRPKDIFHPAALVGVGMALAIFLPWFWRANQLSEGKLFDEFFLKHNVGRFSHAMEGHRGPLWYYLPVLLAGFFPWSLFVIQRISASWKEKREETFLLLIWALIPLLLFSASQTKLPHYILPCLVPLSLFFRGKVTNCCGLMLLILFFLLGILIPLVALPKVDEMRLASAIKKMDKSPLQEIRKMGSTGYLEPGLVFYFQRPVEFMNADEAKERLLSKEPFACLVNQKARLALSPLIHRGRIKSVAAFSGIEEVHGNYEMLALLTNSWKR